MEDNILIFFIIAVHASVVILGAGIAGLNAARTLCQHGVHDILVIEAKQAIGGRISTIRAPNDVTLELGAGWLHGTDGNPVYNYACSHNIATKKSDYTDFTVRSEEGKDVTLDVRKAHRKLMAAKDKIYQLCKKEHSLQCQIFC